MGLSNSKHGSDDRLLHIVAAYSSTVCSRYGLDMDAGELSEVWVRVVQDVLLHVRGEHMPHPKRVARLAVRASERLGARIRDAGVYECGNDTVRDHLMMYAALRASDVPHVEGLGLTCCDDIGPYPCIACRSFTFRELLEAAQGRGKAFDDIVAEYAPP